MDDLSNDRRGVQISSTVLPIRHCDRSVRYGAFSDVRIDRCNPQEHRAGSYREGFSTYFTHGLLLSGCSRLPPPPRARVLLHSLTRLVATMFPCPVLSCHVSPDKSSQGLLSWCCSNDSGSYGTTASRCFCRMCSLSRNAPWAVDAHNGGEVPSSPPRSESRMRR